MTKYIVNVISTWLVVTFNFYQKTYFEYIHHLPTGHIVIPFHRTLKMCPVLYPLGTLESHGWAHSKCTQNVPTGHIGVTQQGIFKMYPTFDHWAYWSHMLPMLSMCSQCAQWVFGPLSPVRRRRTSVPTRGAASASTTSLRIVGRRGDHATGRCRRR